MTDNEYSKTRKAAVDALIYGAKTGLREFTMRDAVNDYLEASGANRPSIGGEETILAHRKIAANRRTKHGQSIEHRSNTMPMQGGGRGYSTDWRLTASMLCPKRSYPKWTGSWRGLLKTSRSKV